MSSIDNRIPALEGRIYAAWDENHCWIVTADYDGYYVSLATALATEAGGAATWETTRVDGCLGSLRIARRRIGELNGGRKA